MATFKLLRATTTLNFPARRSDEQELKEKASPYGCSSYLVVFGANFARSVPPSCSLHALSLDMMLCEHDASQPLQTLPPTHSADHLPRAPHPTKLRPTPQLTKDTTPPPPTTTLTPESPTAVVDPPTSPPPPPSSFLETAKYGTTKTPCFAAPIPTPTSTSMSSTAAAAAAAAMLTLSSTPTLSADKRHRAVAAMDEMRKRAARYRETPTPEGDGTDELTTQLEGLEVSMLGAWGKGRVDCSIFGGVVGTGKTGGTIDVGVGFLRGWGGEGERSRRQRKGGGKVEG